MQNAAVEEIQPEERAELGLDEMAAFAMLGLDIQSGVAEFVPVADPNDIEQVKTAAFEALRRLRVRLNEPYLDYFFGPYFPGMRE